MRSNTEQVVISSPAREVFAYVADPENLPEWATGFAQAVGREGDRWVVTTPAGDVGLRVEADPDLGVVDYVMELAPGAEVTAPTRILPHGDNTVYVFTQLQAPEMPDEVFDRQIEELRRELPQLRHLLEAASP